MAASAHRAEVARMITEMGELQERHNIEVAADWRERGFEYFRAVWVECAEMLDHFGWKWWKQQAPDMPQVELELIDIWHFGLSMLLRDGGFDEALFEQFAADVNPGTGTLEAERFRQQIERLAATAVATQRFDVEAFIACLNEIGMDVPALYRAYIGKNVLNSFRQRNGYKDGSYRKLWGGREDNEHLVEIVATLDAGAAEFAVRLDAALQARYAETA